MKDMLVHFAWAKDVFEIARGLSVNITDGLSSQTVQDRLKRYGVNAFTGVKSRSLLRLFFLQFANPLIIILLTAVLVTFISREFIDSAVIMLAVVTSVGLGFYQERKAERAIVALRSYIEERVRVLRSCREQEINAEELVPGDVMLVRAGERVPADARIISAHELMVDESILTGESLPVHKNTDICAEQTSLSERSSMLFGGTLVAEGQARALVVATGLTTEFGKIAESVLTQREEKTPLQKAVIRISWLVALVTVSLVAMVYGVGVVRGMEHLELFLISVAIAVGAIPEALPPGLTATLAVGVERIAKKKGIVRSLLAAETLGSATVIITDKTGTLTEGRMELVDAIATSELATYCELRSHGPRHDDSIRNLLTLAVSSTSVLMEGEVVSGRPFEVSIVRAAIARGIDVRALRNNVEQIKIFNSKDKYSISRTSDLFTAPGRARADARFCDVAVGAPDVLLGMTDHADEERYAVMQCINTLSVEGKRIVGIAIRESANEEKHHTKTSHASRKDSFEFVGILVLYDPPRKGIDSAIREIEATGVRTIMATGDLPGTARAIANQIGWNIAEEHVLTGDAIRAMSEEDLRDVVSRVRVFARMTPDDKYVLIQALQSAGEVVAMIGDGVNDASSLKRADIGVAVGSGTDVAKGVADLVLLDDDFRTVKTAIDEGSLILANIRKIFIYLMSNAMDEIVLLGGSIFIGLTMPLSALQVIWVNFFTGSLPAIAYAFDTERQHLERSKHSILNREVAVLSFGIGTISSVALLLLYYVLVTYFGIDNAEGRTFLFACFSSYVLFISYSLRNINKPIFTYNTFGNTFLNYGVGAGIALLLATIYIPALQSVFGTVPLGMTWLLAVVVWIVGNIYMVEFTKWALKQRSQDNIRKISHENFRHVK